MCKKPTMSMNFLKESNPHGHIHLRKYSRDYLLWINEQVFWFYISVDDVFAVAVFDRLQKLIDVAAHQIELNAIGILFQDLQQVLLQVLEDEVEAIASIKR